MAIVPTTNYVKFIRGTPTAFANLATKDANTLYFICASGATSGVLYLGDKKIGEGSGSTIIDIAVNNVKDKDVLIYDSSTSTWVNTTLADAIGIMQGASATVAGKTGLVPVPQAGDNNKFLRGDGTWADVGAVDIDTDDNVFTNNLSGKLTLVGFDGAEVGAVLRKSSTETLEWVDPSTFTSSLQTQVTNLTNIVNNLSGGITRKIVASTAAIDLNASDAENYLYMVPNPEGDGDDLYIEYMVIDNQLERVGKDTIDLSSYVTNTTFNNSITSINNKFDNYVLSTKYLAEVGDLTQLLKTQSNGDTLVDQVNDLTERLTWYLITED